MRLVYLETGAPGEGDAALNHAREEGHRVLFRTASAQTRTEPCEGVYTDRKEIREDYASQGVDVFTLAAEPTQPDVDRERYAVGEHAGGGYYRVVDQKTNETVQTATEEKAHEITTELNAQNAGDGDR